jgi:hypothetical protein
MKQKLLSQHVEAVWLPIVEVDCLLVVLKDRRTLSILAGVTRLVVHRATEVLERAKRDQVDGQVMLAPTDWLIILPAVALTIEWLRDECFFETDADDTE